MEQNWSSVIWRPANTAAALDVLRTLDQERLSPKIQFALGLALAKHEFKRGNIHTMPNLAICLVQAKEFQKAIEVLRATAERGQKTAELDEICWRSSIRPAIARFKEAIDALREATQLAPENEDSYVDLATFAPPTTPMLWASRSLKSDCTIIRNPTA